MKLYTLLITLALGLIPNATSVRAVELTNSTQRISYALGMDVIRVLKIDDFKLDLKIVAAGMADMQAGKAALSPEQTKLAMKQMQSDILSNAVAKKEAAGQVHRKEGQAFLAANAKKEGVLIKSVTAPDGSASDLQYKILHSAGASGASPGPTDQVVVHFKGTLIDGTVIDSSEKSGGSATFPMKEVLPGWAAALSQMKPGDRWQLFIPPSLAYADYGPPEIGMFATLIYDLELVSFSPTNTVPASSPTSK